MTKLPDHVHAANVSGLETEQRNRLREGLASVTNTATREQVKTLAIHGVIDLTREWAEANFSYPQSEAEAEILRMQIEFPDVTEEVARDYAVNVMGMRY